MKPQVMWLATAALGVAALTPCGTAAAAPAAHPAAVTSATCKDDQLPDFDRDGLLDLAVGVPGEDRGTVVDAGAVEIRHPCSSQAAQALMLPTKRAGDGFGTSLAVGALNDDDYLDLAVGVPGLDVGGHRDAGGVALFYGSAKGLRYAKTLTEASIHVAGSVQTGARFGQAVSISGYVGDRVGMLRVGEPGRTVAGHRGAGGYVDYALQSGTFVAADSGQVTLASAGVPGSPGTGDSMGAVLFAGSTVGIPNRTVNGAREAGAVLDTTGFRPTLVTQATPGMPGTPETGDHFGAALADQWVGVPGESVGSLAHAGVVDRLADDLEDPAMVLTQHDVDPSQVVEAGDRFGAAITETGSVIDDATYSPEQLLVGAPGQDVSGHADAGTVSVIGEFYDIDSGPFQVLAPYGELQPATAVTGAGFGSVLGRAGLLTVQVGAVGVGGGQVSLFVTPREHDGRPTLVSTLTQEAGTPESGDRYGGALTVSPV